MAGHPMVNHVEMLFPPGQRDVAQALFETMGFATFSIPGGPWIGVMVDPSAGPSSDNVMWANEPTPAQQNLDAALGKAAANDAELAEALQRYQSIRRQHPQYVFHFGASVPTEADWQARVDRLQEANRSHPLLRGRIDVQVSKPGVAGALGRLHQAFIYTDILLTGPAAISPVLFDMQWDPGHVVGESEQGGAIEFPDMARMV